MHLKWGILTAGHIAGSFAAGLKASRTGTLVATGARDLERAEAFAQKWGGGAYGSYAEVLEDPEVEAVYIATPHHLHAEWTIASARAGKAILCEKPFTLNHAEATEAVEAVKRAGVFFMEAFMYRCSPQMRKLVSLLQEESIGPVRAVSAEFSFKSSEGWQNFRTDPTVGGGGIMDVGTYCSSFAQLVAGCEPNRVEYIANIDRGYDSYGVGSLGFPNGVVAKIASGIHLTMRNEATVYGELGNIHIEYPWKSAKGKLLWLNRDGHEPESFDLGCTNDELYAYEADAVADYLLQGECPFMTVAETLANMRTLDRMRASAGMFH
ncbi:MAG: Gfo/Idh/MocA family oxidoreductase [Fimbriimonadaceae bacterium]